MHNWTFVTLNCQPKYRKLEPWSEEFNKLHRSVFFFLFQSREGSLPSRQDLLACMCGLFLTINNLRMSQKSFTFSTLQRLIEFSPRSNCTLSEIGCMRFKDFIFFSQLSFSFAKCCLIFHCLINLFLKTSYLHVATHSTTFSRLTILHLSLLRS